MAHYKHLAGLIAEFFLLTPKPQGANTNEHPQETKLHSIAVRIFALNISVSFSSLPKEMKKINNKTRHEPPSQTVATKRMIVLIVMSFAMPTQL